MANIWEKYISILAGNMNSGLSYLITTVVQSKTGQFQVQTWSVMKIVWGVWKQIFVSDFFTTLI